MLKRLNVTISWINFYKHIVINKIMIVIAANSPESGLSSTWCITFKLIYPSKNWDKIDERQKNAGRQFEKKDLARDKQASNSRMYAPLIGRAIQYKTRGALIFSTPLTSHCMF